MLKVPDTFKVEFDEKRFKYVVNILPEYIKHWETPPLHLVDVAVKGHLEDHFPRRMHSSRFLLDRLKAVWNAYPRYPGQKVVQVVVAEIFPELPGFNVDLDTSNPEQVFLTLPRDAERILSWHPAWLETAANFKIANAGLTGTLNPAQLRILYSRAAHFHEPVENMPISTAQRSNPLKSNKDFHIIANAQRLELEVIIGAIRSMTSEEAQQRLFEDIDSTLWRLVHAFGRTPFYKDFRKIIRRSIQVALQQPQALGLDMPLVIPGGFFLKEETAAPKLAELKTIAAFFQTLQPEKTVSHVSFFDREDMKARGRHLLKRGIIGSATLYPVSSLNMMDQDVAADFLDFAKHGRSTQLSSQRELQAMVFTLPGLAAERYRKEVENFWQEFLQAYGASREGGQTITVISHFFPLSVNPRERKPLAQGRKRQDHDGASWLPMIVREIITLPHVPADPAGIASCLAPNVSEIAVKKALDSLLAAGLISYDPVYRRYQQRERNVVTGDDKASEKILRIHEEMSELAAAVLEDPPEHMRSIAINLLMDPQLFEAARQRIRVWLHGLLDRTAKERDQDQLYQLSVQMFQGPN